MKTALRALFWISINTENAIKAGSGRMQGTPGSGTSGVFSDQDSLKPDLQAVFVLNPDLEQSGEDLQLAQDMTQLGAQFVDLLFLVCRATVISSRP
ncbi:MAG: hypothetical protein ACLGQX_13545 [Acidobacteriota bacterium]